MTLRPRNILALCLIIISLCCLYPGLVKPILSVNIGAEIPLLGKMSLHRTTQSIFDTIQTLYKNNNSLVANLILLFSVIIPILKAIILLLILFIKKIPQRKNLQKLVAIISKWSMADVFIVGVFLAFLATSSDDSIDAKLEVGFYYFLTYCIISILAAQVIIVDD